MVKTRSRSECSRGQQKAQKQSSEESDTTIRPDASQPTPRNGGLQVVQPTRSPLRERPFFGPTTSSSRQLPPSDSQSNGEHTEFYMDYDVERAQNKPNKNKLFDAKKAFDIARLKLELARLESGDISNQNETLTVNTPCTRVSSNINLALPPIQIDHFDGDPKSYIQFINQFKYYIETQVADSCRRLTYLIQYCRGSAKEAIHHCLMMDPETGYHRARELLRQRFGRDHVVVRAMLDSITDQRQIRASETDRLCAFSVKLRSCAIALSGVHHEGELNSSPTLEAIVRILPPEWRKLWAHRADGIFSSRNITFEDLCGFVEDQVRIADSRYGRLALAPDLERRGFSDSRENTDRKVHHVKAERAADSCVVCSKEHPIWRCVEFQGLSLQHKWERVKGSRLCHRCLRSGHSIEQCKGANHCMTPGCSSKYHRYLHNHLQERNHPLLHNHSEQAGQHMVNVLSTGSRVCPILNTIPVMISGPSGSTATYALIDNGSEATVIQADLLKSIGLTPRDSQVVLTTIAGSNSKVKQTSLWISPLVGDPIMKLDRCLVIDHLNIKPSKSFDSGQIQWEGDPVEFPTIPDKTVKLILGTDQPELQMVIEQRKAKNQRLLAIRTQLGWSVSGLVRSDCETGQRQCGYTGVDRLLKRLYDAEFDDADDRQSMSQEDRKALEIAKDSLRTIQGHYEIGLPWRIDPTSLPNNYYVCRRRLEGLKSRFRRDNKFCDSYTNALRKSIDEGYVVKVPERQLDPRYPVRWYLPHHAVVNPKKPAKFRVVFDCAAKHEGLSLNDALLQGPDMVNNLLGVLMRFRMGSIAVTADIEAMFMQVKVPAKDRAALRFLWFEDSDVSRRVIEYQMAAHPFGAVSSPFCASFALRHLTEQFGSECSDKTKFAVHHQFYVDDCLAAFNCHENARAFTTEIRALLARGGFNLTKWVSNCPSILPDAKEQPEIGKIPSGNPDKNSRVLGIDWDTATDELCYKLAVPNKPLTRRGLLSMIASVYDPIGVIAPVMLMAKKLLQELCRKRADWDQKLDEDSLCSWIAWKEATESLGTVRIPRAVPTNEECLQLHVFSDASETGFGAVVYAVNSAEPKSTHLLLAKCRVAPIKSVTIPRLELNAAALGVKLTKTARYNSGLERCPVLYWTDSMIVLHYIKNQSSRFNTFVANRLTSIHDATSVAQWRYIPTKLNPADLLSRGVKTQTDLEYWRKGPVFLLSDDPSLTFFDCPRETTFPLEMKRKTDRISQLSVSANSDIERILPIIPESVEVNAITIEPWEDAFNRYSCWLKILKCVAWLSRYAAYVRVMYGRQASGNLNVGPLSSGDIHSARNMLIQTIQIRCYPGMFERGHGSQSVCHNQLRRLNPIVVEGILRVGGRVYPYDGSVHPIIIPGSHWISDKLIMHQHKLEGHCGPMHVLSSLRQRFWITGAKSAIKRVIRSCWVCTRQNTPLTNQIMAPLAQYQHQAGWFPFAHVGVDYFGPFFAVVGRKQVKRFVCVFSCLQIRAVHLEPVHSLTTDSFILSLKRFIARRGCPQTFYSDNGSNLVGCVRELKQAVEALSASHISDFLLVREVEWKFNPPYASHRGGLWERMIRSVRRTLWSIIGNRVLSEEAFGSFLTEVEGILNNRPIVPLSDFPDQEPLTPNHLLLLRTSSLTIVPSSIEDVYRKTWHHVNKLVNQFWSRWSKEYIPLLQPRQKWLRCQRNIKEGDVVIIASEKTSRNVWPLGVVQEAVLSSDGLVRSVKIKTATGIITRDVRKIGLVEGAADAFEETPS